MNNFARLPSQCSARSCNCFGSPEHARARLLACVPTTLTWHKALPFRASTRHPISASAVACSCRWMHLPLCGKELLSTRKGFCSPGRKANDCQPVPLQCPSGQPRGPWRITQGDRLGAEQRRRALAAEVRAWHPEWRWQPWPRQQLGRSAGVPPASSAAVVRLDLPLAWSAVALAHPANTPTGRCPAGGTST